MMDHLLGVVRFTWGIVWTASDRHHASAAKLAPKSTLKIYKGGAHGLAETQRNELNADLLAFIKG
jgi:hypothetical protein